MSNLERGLAAKFLILLVLALSPARAATEFLSVNLASLSNAGLTLIPSPVLNAGACLQGAICPILDVTVAATPASSSAIPFVYSPGRRDTFGSNQPIGIDDIAFLDVIPSTGVPRSGVMALCGIGLLVLGTLAARRRNP